MRSVLVLLCFLSAVAGQSADTVGLRVVVSQSAEMVPIEWRVEFAAGAVEVTAVFSPSLSWEYWSDGTYRGMWGLPAEDPRSAGGYRKDGGEGSGNPFQPATRVAPMGRAAWIGQCPDWRLCAFPGRYRVKAVGGYIVGPLKDAALPMGGFHTTPIASDWHEFTVAAEGAGCVVLQRARDAKEGIWGTYCRFMDLNLDVNALQANPGLDSFVSKMLGVAPVGLPMSELDALMALDGLPSGLLHRLRLMTALQELRLGRSAVDSVERTNRISRASVLGATVCSTSESAFSRPLGRWVMLAAAEAAHQVDVAQHLRSQTAGDTELAQAFTGALARWAGVDIADPLVPSPAQPPARGPTSGWRR